MNLFMRQIEDADWNICNEKQEIFNLRRITTIEQLLAEIERVKWIW